MTIQELAALVGRTGRAKVGPFQVAVTVQDVKDTYGRVRYLVAPVHGSGTAWMEGVTLDPAA